MVLSQCIYLSLDVINVRRAQSGVEFPVPVPVLGLTARHGVQPHQQVCFLTLDIIVQLMHIPFKMSQWIGFIYIRTHAHTHSCYLLDDMSFVLSDVPTHYPILTRVNDYSNHSNRIVYFVQWVTECVWVWVGVCACAQTRRMCRPQRK